jgi:hypothetical protein
MARARNIKPGFARNEDLAECSFVTRLCFALLPTLADREGRLEDRPKRIKGELFPFDNVEVEPLLVELERRGLIVRYAVDDVALIQILAFLKHQNPHHREPPSTLPTPPGLRLDADGKWVKPEAQMPLDGIEASGEPGADGSCEPGKGRPSPPVPRGVSRVDSGLLIPDSGVGAKSRGSRLPTDWAPDGTDLAYAAEKGLANGRALLEAEKFRDYWTAEAGPRASKANWQAAWRTWVRNAIEYAGKRGGSPGGDDPFAGAH